MGIGERRWWTAVAAVAAVVAVAGVVVMRYEAGQRMGWNEANKSAVMQWFQDMSDRLGYWAIPACVGVHTVNLALCIPYAVFFEAGASMLFGSLLALLCVFSAKVLGASLSFWIGRVVFKNSGSAANWVQKNKYFHVLSRGVERDGWKFVLLARFSPVLLPILASAAVTSASGKLQQMPKERSQVWSYVFPLLAIFSSFVISLRIKKYSSEIAVSEPTVAEKSN